MTNLEEGIVDKVVSDTAIAKEVIDKLRQTAENLSGRKIEFGVWGVSKVERTMETGKIVSVASTNDYIKFAIAVDGARKQFGITTDAKDYETKMYYVKI